MAVTMQQVAELAGVSRGTVDRVMHGRPNVNPMVREKVLRAAEKLGYTCKKAAAAPTHRASILIPQWTDTYFNRQVISGIRRALRYIADNSFELVEVPLRTMTSQELVGAIEQQVQDGVDGLIIRAENTPEVYLAIRQALDKGHPRHYLRRRYSGQRSRLLCGAGSHEGRCDCRRRHGAADTLL